VAHSAAALAAHALQGHRASHPGRRVVRRGAPTAPGGPEPHQREVQLPRRRSRRRGRRRCGFGRAGGPPR
ncbi:unnamed protein product, partial [Prorocentrum cordatum]